MAFLVQTTRRADRDIAAAEEFVGLLGRGVLARWRKRLFKAIDKLEFNPHRYPAAEAESTTLQMDMREAPAGRRPHVYRILFTIDRDTVTIYRVRHAAQDFLTTDDL